MKIRATRTFLNDIGLVRRGAEVDIQDVQAKSLIGRGLAVATNAPAAPEPPKVEKPHVTAGKPPKKRAPAQKKEGA